MFYFLALNSGPFISGNDISIHPVIAFNSSNVYRSMHGTSDYNLFDSYLQEYIHVKKQHKDNIFGNILYWISFYYST